jgi:hypothetical protein
LLAVISINLFIWVLGIPESAPKPDDFDKKHYVYHWWSNWAQDDDSKTDKAKKFYLTVDPAKHEIDLQNDTEFHVIMQETEMKVHNKENTSVVTLKDTGDTSVAISKDGNTAKIDITSAGVMTIESAGGATSHLVLKPDGSLEILSVKTDVTFKGPLTATFEQVANITANDAVNLVVAKPLVINGSAKIDVTASAAVNITAGAPTSITAPAVSINAPTISLGGGLPIARQGDPVAVNPSTHAGTITGGGANTSA